MSAVLREQVALLTNEITKRDLQITLLTEKLELAKDELVFYDQLIESIISEDVDSTDVRTLLEERPDDQF